MKMRRAFAVFLSVMMTFSMTAYAAPESASGTASIDADAIPTGILNGDYIKADIPEAGAYEEGRLLVKVHDQGASLMSSGKMFSDYARDSEYLFSIDGENEGDAHLSGLGQAVDKWYLLELKDEVDMFMAMEEIAEMEGVLAVEPDYIRYIDKTETGEGSSLVCEGLGKRTTDQMIGEDKYIHAQTYLDCIDAVEAWEDGNNIGEGVVVAVVDSGVDMDHPDLVDNLLTNGYDFYNDDADPDDDNGHGTHVAGTIAASANETGVRGVAYGSKVLPVKVMSGEGYGDDSTISNGIKYAADQKVNVINISLGGFGKSLIEGDAIRYAQDKGCLVVVAAGNDTYPTAPYEDDANGGAYAEPADTPGVLTVMAYDEHYRGEDSVCGGLATFSNYDSDPGEGYEYQVMAPGVDILSTYMGGGYERMSGTSMACPVTAGAAAVLIGMGCDAEEAYNLISSCTEKDAVIVPFSYPLLNLKECVDKVAVSDPVTGAPVLTDVSVSVNVDEFELTHTIGEETTAKTTSLNGMDTDGRMFFYNGDLVSDLVLKGTNIGAGGKMTVTGSIGGHPIREATYDVPYYHSAEDKVFLDGEESEIVLEPASSNDLKSMVNEDGNVEIVININGAQVLSEEFQAYEVKTPDMAEGVELKNIFTTDNGYVLDEKEVTLSGSADLCTVWVLDHVFLITSEKTLNIVQNSDEKAVAVYENPSCMLQVSEGGKVNLTGLELRAKKNFAKTSTGDLSVRGCSITSPYFKSVNSLSESEITSNGYTVQILSADEISRCSFYKCSGMTVAAKEFKNNMVNRCPGGMITVNTRAVHNTFVENYTNSNDSVLKVRVPDYSNTGGVEKGFYENCVIGPLDVTSSSTEYAKISRVYYQSVDAYNAGKYPGQESDYLRCSKESVTGDTLDELDSWGFADECPAFITKVETVGSEVDGVFVWYRMKVEFSTPIDKNIGAESYGVDELFLYPEVEIADDGSYLTFEGYTKGYGKEYNLYYGAEDFAALGSEELDMSHTVLREQSTYCFPVRFDTSRDYGYTHNVSVSGNSSSRTITLGSEFADPDYEIIVQRFENGKYKKSFALSSGQTEYIDNDEIAPGTELMYQTIMYRYDKLECFNQTHLYIPYPDSQLGMIISPKEYIDADTACLSLTLEKDVNVGNKSSFYFPGVKAEAVHFCDTAALSSLKYCVDVDGSGTTVTFEDGNRIYGGEPLFIIAGDADYNNEEAGTAVAKRNGTTQKWALDSFCEFKIHENLIKYSVNKDLGTYQYWIPSENRMVIAEYNENGKMLSCDSVSGGAATAQSEAGKDLRGYLLDQNSNPVCKVMAF